MYWWYIRGFVLCSHGTSSYLFCLLALYHMHFLFAIYSIYFFNVFLLILYLFIKSICFMLRSVRNFLISVSNSGDILSSCPCLRPDFLVLAAIPSFIPFTVISLSCSARSSSTRINSSQRVSHYGYPFSFCVCPAKLDYTCRCKSGHGNRQWAV